MEEYSYNYYDDVHCRLWFLRPLCDLSVLTSRQDAIEFLMSPQNEELASTMHSCVKQIRHVSVSSPPPHFPLLSLSPSHHSHIHTSTHIHTLTAYSGSYEQCSCLYE